MVHKQLDLEFRRSRNTHPVWGLGDDQVAETIAKLFRRRNDLSDYLGLRFIKAGFRGFQQAETEHLQGIPAEILDQLDTQDVLALYIGYGLLHQQFSEAGLIGKPPEILIPELVHFPYTIAPKPNHAANPVREMSRMKLGYQGHVESGKNISE